MRSFFIEVCNGVSRVKHRQRRNPQKKKIVLGLDEVTQEESLQLIGLERRIHLLYILEMPCCKSLSFSSILPGLCNYNQLVTTFYINETYIDKVAPKQDTFLPK